ncbi:hypothetical protein [Rhodoflexus sp.]
MRFLLSSLLLLLSFGGFAQNSKYTSPPTTEQVLADIDAYWEAKTEIDDTPLTPEQKKIVADNLYSLYGITNLNIVDINLHPGDYVAMLMIADGKIKEHIKFSTGKILSMEIECVANDWYQQFINIYKQGNWFEKVKPINEGKQFYAAVCVYGGNKYYILLLAVDKK